MIRKRAYVASVVTGDAADISQTITTVPEQLAGILPVVQSLSFPEGGVLALNSAVPDMLAVPQLPDPLKPVVPNRTVSAARSQPHPVPLPEFVSSRTAPLTEDAQPS